MKFHFLFLFIFGVSLLSGAQERAGEIIEWGNYSEKIRYDEQNRPLEVIISRKGLLEETASYTYGENRINIKTTAEREPGEPIEWEDILYLREDGSLRMMERKGDFSFSGRDSLSRWTAHGDYSEIVIYNKLGVVDRRAVYQGETLVEEETFQYGPLGELKESQLKNYLIDEEQDFVYIKGGKVKEERLYRSDLLVSHSLYTYNKVGQPVEKVTMGKGQTQSWTADYDGDGQLIRENYYLNGLLVRVVNYEEEGKIEEYFNKGRLSLKVYYKNGEMINEEKFD